jgi:hypothetical protein
VFVGVIDKFVLTDLLSSSVGNGSPPVDALGTTMLAVSLVIALIGFLGYR